MTTVNGDIDVAFSEHQSRLTTRGELNNAVQPLLTDLYQLSMAYAYWKTQNKDRAVFDLFFRRNPFHGEFTIFAGLEECLKFIQDFHFSDTGQSTLSLTRCLSPLKLGMAHGSD